MNKGNNVKHITRATASDGKIDAVAERVTAALVHGLKTRTGQKFELDSTGNY